MADTKHWGTSKKRFAASLNESGYNLELGDNLSALRKRAKRNFGGLNGVSFWRQIEGGNWERVGDGKSNPLPVGRFIKVKAIRRKNGRVDLYRA